MKARRPRTTQDLSPSERRFLEAMHQLRFGHFRDLPIKDGKIILQPAPVAIRQLKFGTTDPATSKQYESEFALRQEVADFFQHVRSIQHGELRLLQVRNGLPILAEEEHPLVSEGDNEGDHRL